MSYLFTRSIRVAGNPIGSMSWSARITEKVNQIAEIQVSLWTPVMSPQINTLTWTAVVTDLAALTATDEKLMADSGYLDLVAEGAAFDAGTGVDDQLIKLVYTDPDGGDTAQYAATVRAVLAPGSFREGMALGVDIAKRAKAISGRPTTFGISSTGVYGEVGWITLYDSIEQVQQSEEAVNANEAFLALLDEKASTAYLPGEAKQVISRKVM